MALADLSGKIGLPLKLDGSKLVFGKGMKKTEVDIRTRERMQSVLKNPQPEAPSEFYYMYRDVALEKDRAKIRENNLRFDITILPPFKVGDEYNKTYGHYHPMVPGTSTWYPELYEVIAGRAHYLLQNGSEFLVFDARAGDKCLMLPGFAHVTVNPSLSETLVMANWVCPGFNSDYAPIEAKGGAEWFETTRGFVPNQKYSRSAPIKLIKPKEFPEFAITKKPMYLEGIKAPKNLEFLDKPQKFAAQFAKYLEQ